MLCAKPKRFRASPFEDIRLMTDAHDEGYNEGRLAFRRYFANYGVLWLNGFESELRRHVAFTPSTGGFRDIEERPRLR